MTYRLLSRGSLGAIDEAGCERARQLATIVFSASNWKPVGDRYYTANLIDLHAATVRALLQTHAKVVLALGRYYTSPPLWWARDALQRDIETSTIIANEIAAANRRGATVIIVPGFKSWCERTLNDCGRAVGEVAYRDCMRNENTPGLGDVINTITEAAASIYRGTVAVIDTTGQIIYAAAKLPGDIAEALEKAARLSMYAGVAYLAYLVLRKKRKQ